MDDERYSIAESEHISQLQEYHIRDLGVLIGTSSVGLNDWKTLAGRLGIDNDDVRRLEAMARDCGNGSVVPGEEVLKLWRQRDGSTIRILLRALAGMKRDDVITRLNDMRRNVVEFPIVLKQDGQENSVLWVECPGRKPLIEHVRPLLSSRLDLRSVGHGQRVEFHLTVEADWSAPAETFAGRECTMTQKSVGTSLSETKRKSAPTRPSLRHPSSVKLNRNVISALTDRETLVFGYSPTAEATSPVAASTEAVPVSASWTSSNGNLDDDRLQFENDLNDRREVTEARLLPGFHDIDRRRKEQVTVLPF